MIEPDVLESKWYELGFVLQRKVWKPLRSMMDIFHVLPLVAVVILFVLLATDGQFRELYISYLEGPAGSTASWLVSIVAALLAIALISAVLYEAHYSLSTMRINVVYSSSSDPEAGSRLRRLQKSAAFVLAFLPWLGITVGLLGARNFVALRYCQLLDRSGMQATELHNMQHLPLLDGWTIAGAVTFLGLATAYFSSSGDQNRIAQRAVACFAPSLAVLLFLLFTDWLNIKAWNSYSTLIGLIIAAVTLGYFLIYQSLYKRRGGFLYTDPGGRTGISLRKRRRRILAVWAFLPWVFLALYFAVAQYLAPAPQWEDSWTVCPLSASRLPVPGHWSVFPVAMCCTFAIGLLTGHVLGRYSTSRWRRLTIVAMVSVLAAGVIVLAWHGDVGAIVRIYRVIGPVGTASLQLLFLISTFAILAALSQRSGFPALTLVMLALVISVMFPNYVGHTVVALGIVCGVFGTMALLSGRRAIAAVLLILPLLGALSWWQSKNEVGVAQNPPAEEIDRLAVKAQFACWLGQRGIPAKIDQQGLCPGAGAPPASAADDGPGARTYPVFIIAAEGGGIYAASAASTFLSRLVEVSPHFDEHVFAISGVSGGAIGSAIFQAFDHAAHIEGPAPAGAASTASDPCAPVLPDPQQVKKTLLEKVEGIMQDDHFSPVVGSIFPELFGARLTRADALVASFENSASARDAIALQQLCAPFAQHWSAAGAAPALILNATWVETGFRAAFAPFHLHGIDESLYSFSDPQMPDEKNVKLMDAAAVSARFPLIVPPFSVLINTGKRWNFVDGAYSDNSGASTALDIYKALEDVAPPNVDLRIILITSSNPQPDLLGNDISGTVFRDTLAPLDALMKVREDLGNDAVARACTYIYKEDVKNRNNPAAPKPVRRVNRKNDNMEVNQFCIDNAGHEDATLQLVEIQDQTYGLALGWKISRTSFAVVSWMLGKPANCSPEKLQPQSQPQPLQSQPPQPQPPSAAPDDVQTVAEAPEQDENKQLTDAILQRNSCIMKSIVDLVAASRVSRLGTPAPKTAN